MPTESQKFYLIKDLARLSGQSVYTLKFYLKLGLIHEAGRSPETRFRYFNDDTLAHLASIRSLRKQEKSLAQIRELLLTGSGLKARGSGQVPAAQSPQPTAAT
jgi:DNA-binding transcriptional MerR regulator